MLDVGKLSGTGWKAKIDLDLDSGIKSTYEWLQEQLAEHAALRGY